ncbi:MAG: sensor histidine kinase, partial [Anaerolineae bacterium]|nr:sensor histidine kinase [Anaerolineae bacterium]
EWVRIFVEDDGEGILPEDLPHVFEPFYRGDRSRSRRRGGTGLGLTLSKALVEAHGGEIGVSSEPERGTKFTIRLPRSEG